MTHLSSKCYSNSLRNVRDMYKNINKYINELKKEKYLSKEKC